MIEPGQSIRLSDWLDSRSPSPPDALRQRLLEVAGDTTCTVGEVAGLLLGRAQAMLVTIGNDRSAALDLLTADALITYAMEAAAENQDDLESFTAEAAVRISAVRIE